MPGEQNDLLQLKQARGILASVYRTQATDAMVDNSNLMSITNAIFNINNAIKWLEEHTVKGK